PGPSFQVHTEQQKDLYKVSVVKKVSNARPLARYGFIGMLVVLIAAIAFGKMSLFFALLIITGYMVATKLLSIREIKQELDVDLLVILVSSLTFSTALIKSGTAEIMAQGFMGLFEPFGNLGVILGIYLVTLI